MMHWTGWIVAGVSVAAGGWMVFDGARAIIVGEYVTPQSGDYAGQLGPWSHLVKAVGLDPKSTAVKVAHIVLGLALMGSAAAFALHVAWARIAVLSASVLVLWYAPFGTAAGVINLVLLPLPGLRGG